MKPGKENEPLNLSINTEVILRMKIWCTANRRRIGELTQQLYIEFLAKQNKKPIAIPSRGVRPPSNTR